MVEKKGAKEIKPLKKTRSVWFLILVLLLVFLVVGIASFYLMGGSIFGLGGDNASKNSKNEFSEAGSLGPLMEMDAFVVNIADGNRTRFLKVGITLEMTDYESKDEIDHRMPQIRDTIITQASSKEYREVRDMQGKKQLRLEIQREINSILARGEVEQVFFTEFVIQ